MGLSRRIQLVKLLRAHGLRGVERMREDELKEALGRLRAVGMGEAHGAEPAAVHPGVHPAIDTFSSLPSSSAFVARPSEPPPALPDDADDPWALPRFREPRVAVPEGLCTFVRAIAVKPRLLFVTWDVQLEERLQLEGPVELQVFWRDFLGDAPPTAEILRGPPAFRSTVDLASSGWYVAVPGDRLALVAVLAVEGTGRRIAASNVTLAPPARPAPPGPHWEATLPPSLDRRRLHDRALFEGEVAQVRRVGEADARTVSVTAEDDADENEELEGDEVEIETHSSSSLVRSARLKVRRSRPPLGGVPSSSALAGRSAGAAKAAGSSEGAR